MAKGKVHTQHSALPFTLEDGKLRVLLITSRDTGRWVIPKGWPEKGLAPYEVAADEAFEEAGLIGSIARHPIGTFEYVKGSVGKSPKRCRVLVFPLEVERQLNHWPEMHERRRAWMSPAEAAQRIEEPQLASLILSFATPQTVQAGPRRA